MEKLVFSLRDRQAGIFHNPVFAVSLGQVVRELTDVVNRPSQEILFLHPADFQLYKLGTFDDVKGVFSLLPIPDMVLDCGTLRIPAGMPEGHKGNGSAIPVAGVDAQDGVGAA